MQLFWAFIKHVCNPPLPANIYCICWSSIIFHWTFITCRCASIICHWVYIIICWGSDEYRHVCWASIIFHQALWSLLMLCHFTTSAFHENTIYLSWVLSPAAVKPTIPQGTIWCICSSLHCAYVACKN